MVDKDDKKTSSQEGKQFYSDQIKHVLSGKQEEKERNLRWKITKGREITKKEKPEKDYLSYLIKRKQDEKDDGK